MRTKQSRSSCWAESKIKMGANWKVSSERPHTHACGTRIMLFKIYFSKKLAKKQNRGENVIKSCLWQKNSRNMFLLNAKFKVKKKKTMNNV